MARDQRRSSSRYLDEEDEADYYARPTRQPGTLGQGLINTGNTCFMNSVVQSLASVEAFHLYVYSLLDKESAPTEAERKSRMPVASSLKQTLKDLTVPGARPLVPAISSVPTLKTRFLTGQQQDAHEFMSYLLDILEGEEEMPTPDASAQSVVSDGRPMRRQLKTSRGGFAQPRNSMSGSSDSAMGLLPQTPSRKPVHSSRRKAAGFVGALEVLSPDRRSSKLSASTPISPLYINGSKVPLSMSASVFSTPNGDYIGILSPYSPKNLPAALDRSTITPTTLPIINVPDEQNHRNTTAPALVAPSPVSSKKVDAVVALLNGTSDVHDDSATQVTMEDGKEPNHYEKDDVEKDEKDTNGTDNGHGNGHAVVVKENGTANHHGEDSGDEEHHHMPNGTPNGTVADASASDSDQDSGTVDSHPPTAGAIDGGKELTAPEKDGTTSDADAEAANGHAKDDTPPNGVEVVPAGVEKLIPVINSNGVFAEDHTLPSLSQSTPVGPVVRPLTPPSLITPQHDHRFDRYIQERKKKFAQDSGVLRMKNPLAGLMESTLFCETCHRSSSTVQKILDISLYTPTTPNPNTPTGNYRIEDCLAQFSQDEEVQGVWCEGCHQKRVMKKRLTIARAPDVLCIHLHRIHNVARGAAVLKKTSTFVRFATKLNLAPYSSAAAGSFSKTKSQEHQLGMSPFTDSPYVTPSVSPYSTPIATPRGSPPPSPRSGRSSADSSRPMSRSASRDDFGKASHVSHRRPAAKTRSTPKDEEKPVVTQSTTSSMLSWVLSMFTSQNTTHHEPTPLSTPISSPPSSRATSPAPMSSFESDGEFDDSASVTSDDGGTSTPKLPLLDAQPPFSHLGWRNSTGLPRQYSKTGIAVPRPGSEIVTATLGRQINPVDESDYDYELEAIIVHLGDAGGGHYVMYRKLQPNLIFQTSTEYETSMRRKIETISLSHNPSLHQWLYISDHSVSLVDEAKVLQQEAYMLFYQKVQKPHVASSVLLPHR